MKTTQFDPADAVENGRELVGDASLMSSIAS